MRHRVLVMLSCLLVLGVAALGPKWVGGWVTHAQSGATYVINSYASYQTHTLNHPTGLAFSSSAVNLYISDTGNNVIRVLRSNTYPPTLSVAAGNGTAGHVDGLPSSAEFNNPTGISAYTKLVPNASRDAGEETWPCLGIT